MAALYVTDLSHQGEGDLAYRDSSVSNTTSAKRPIRKADIMLE